MKIVVLDGHKLNPGDLSWDKIAELGDLKLYDITENKTDVISERIKDADIVLISKSPINREAIARCTKLKYIGILATGYNMIDLAAAKERGITVTNVPAYGTAAVSQMAIALLLEMCHHTWIQSENVKAGGWTEDIDLSFMDNPLIELYGKTLGIIGYGRIGQSTAKIAQAMGMNILAYNSKQIQAENSEIIKFVDLDELLKKSDVISLHCPLFDTTRGMINKDTISKMKDGVYIVNTSRGPLISEKDLADALNSGKVAGAAVDVVSAEPIKMDNPLLKAKNCIITPHIAWAPRESRARLMNIAVNNLKSFLEGKSVNTVE